MKGFLTDGQRKELEKEQNLERKKRYVVRIWCILKLDEGKKLEELAAFYFLHENTVRNYLKSYKKGGLKELTDDKHSGLECRLNKKQLAELERHLDEKIYLRVADVQQYIKTTYTSDYSQRGVRHILKRLGFVYKKPKKVPGKADKSKQAKFLEELEEEKKTADALYYLDGVHPQHNTQAACGWIKKGKVKEIKTNTGRKRVNINGALNLDDHLDVIAHECDSVNAQSTIELFKKIEVKHPQATKILVLSDNARYYNCYLVKDYLKNSPIEIKFLPTYSPNLNLIERLWRHLRKTVLYNQYYEKFATFRQAIFDYFQNIGNYKSELKTLLNPKFNLIGN